MHGLTGTEGWWARGLTAKKRSKVMTPAGHRGGRVQMRCGEGRRRRRVGGGRALRLVAGPGERKSGAGTATRADRKEGNTQ